MNIKALADEGKMLIKALKEHIKDTEGVNGHFQIMENDHRHSLLVSCYGLKILFRVELKMNTGGNCNGLVSSYILPLNEMKDEITLGKPLKFPNYNAGGCIPSHERKAFAAKILAEVADGFVRDNFDLKLQ